MARGSPDADDDDNRENTELLAQCDEKDSYESNRQFCRDNGIPAGRDELRALQRFVSQGIIKLLDRAGIRQQNGQPYVNSCPKGFLQYPSIWLEDHGYKFKGWPGGVPQGSVSIWPSAVLYCVARMLINDTISVVRLGSGSRAPRPQETKRPRHKAITAVGTSSRRAKPASAFPTKKAPPHPPDPQRSEDSGEDEISDDDEEITPHRPPSASRQFAAPSKTTSVSQPIGQLSPGSDDAHPARLSPVTASALPLPPEDRRASTEPRSPSWSPVQRHKISLPPLRSITEPMHLPRLSHGIANGSVGRPEAMPPLRGYSGSLSPPRSLPFPGEGTERAKPTIASRLPPPDAFDMSKFIEPVGNMSTLEGIKRMRAESGPRAGGTSKRSKPE